MKNKGNRTVFRVMSYVVFTKIENFWMMFVSNIIFIFVWDNDDR